MLNNRQAPYSGRCLWYSTHSRYPYVKKFSARFLSTKSSKHNLEMSEKTLVTETESAVNLLNTPSQKISLAEVSSLANLQNGRSLLKSNASPGVDAELKTDISDDRLKKLSQSLLKQQYKPKPSRKVTLTEPCGKQRILGVVSAIDKVVQATLKLLLEPLLEKTFSEHSFGFRPKKSTHDALQAIRYK